MTVDKLKRLYEKLNKSMTLEEKKADFADAIEDHCFPVAANIGRTAGFTDEQLVDYVTELKIQGIFDWDFKAYLKSNNIVNSLSQEANLPWDTYKHAPDHSLRTSDHN